MISYNHILAHERYLVVTMQWAFCETWESNASGPPCCEACGGRYHLKMESMAPSWLAWFYFECNLYPYDPMQWRNIRCDEMNPYDPSSVPRLSIRTRNG